MKHCWHYPNLQSFGGVGEPYCCFCGVLRYSDATKEHGEFLKKENCVETDLLDYPCPKRLK